MLEVTPVTRSFMLAPMSPAFRWFTIALWILPFGYMVAGWIWGPSVLGAVGLFLIAVYGSVWFAWRPSYFNVTPTSIDIVSPLWLRQLALDNVANVCLLTKTDFQRKFGRTLRIGAGGLWGGFGWLWTQKQGTIAFYISRQSNYVLVEPKVGKSLLITPEQPQMFVKIVKAAIA